MRTIITIFVEVALLLLSIHFCLLYRKQKKINAEQKKKTNSERSKLYFNLLMEWTANKQDNKTMENFFRENQIKRVVIYGMGNLEELLYKELMDLSLDICGYVDQNAAAYQSFYSNIVTVDEIDRFADADAVIVTPFFAIDSISKSIHEKLDIRVISIEELVFSMK